MSLITYLKANGVPEDHPALIEGGRTLTYRELWDQADQLARGFHDLGLQRLDHVALALPNSALWILSFLAILRAGGVVVPLQQTATATELKRLLIHCKPSLLIANRSFVNRSLPFDLPQLKGIENAVICSKRLMSRYATERIIPIDNLLKQIYQVELDEPADSESEAASISYTYRGYGYPLGAILTHSNFRHGIDTYVRTTNLRKEQRFLLMLPLSHVYALIGSVLAPLRIGSTIIVVRTPTVENIWQAISEHHPNVLTGVPSIYASLCRSPRRSNGSLKNIEQAFCGGSLMPVSLYSEVSHGCGISLRQGYGMTESLPVTCNPPASKNRPDTLGKVGVGVKLKVVGEDGCEKRTGEIGEIIISGPTVMRGYYGMPKETSQVLKDGWLYTGDKGWFDRKGYLHFNGLKKRISKVASKMVDLTEVEREVSAYHGVRNARVYMIPHQKWGEVVAAEVNYMGNEEGKRNIRRYLRNRLASHKVPQISVVES